MSPYDILTDSDDSNFGKKGHGEHKRILDGRITINATIQTTTQHTHPPLDFILGNTPLSHTNLVFLGWASILGRG